MRSIGWRRARNRTRAGRDVGRLFERLAEPLRDRPGDARRVERLGRDLADAATGRLTRPAVAPVGGTPDDVLSSRGT